MNLLEYAIRSSAVLACGFAALAFLRRGSASLRHAILCASIVFAALAGPLAHATPWTWGVTIPLVEPTVTPWADVKADASVADIPSAPQQPRGTMDGARRGLLWAVPWLAGFVLLSVRRAHALLRLRRAASTAAPVTVASWNVPARDVARAIGLTRRVRLCVTDRAGLLATWGVWAPRLVMPPTALHWSRPRILAVLGHELEHVRRRDWLVQMVAEVARDLNWWNPLFWWACRRLRLESERACDDAVLRLGVDVDDYARHLVEIARTCMAPRRQDDAAVAMARPSTLHRRIESMLNPRLSRSAVPLPAAALIVVAALAVTLPVVALRGQEPATRPLTGVLLDPDGAVLPNVVVNLDGASGAPATARTDAAGRFAFPPVAAGKYVLRVSQPGFKALSMAVELRAPKDWTQSLVLQLGDVQETISVTAPRVARSVAVAQPAKVRVGGNIRPPMKVKDVKPEYPSAMREAGEQGTVLLDTIISTDGTVQSVRVVPSPAHQALVDSAIAAVRQWKFEPTRLNGSPVEVVMRVSIGFALDE